MQSLDTWKDQALATALMGHSAQRPALSADAAKACKRSREFRNRLLLSPTSRGDGIHADQRESRSSVHLDFLCGAEQPDDANANAAVHAADQCLLKVIAQFEGCLGFAFCLLQFCADSW